MGKLEGRGLGRRLGREKSRLRAAPLKEDREKRRYKEQPWRAWYSSPRWQAVRRRVIERDRGICQQTGVALVGGANAPNSPVVDHIVPHRGDERLFWDESNLQTVAKRWHDRVKQKRERSDLGGGGV